MTAIDPRRREMSRLRRDIAYYCGVIARAISRERIRHAHAVIRLRERQLRNVRSRADEAGNLR